MLNENQIEDGENIKKDKIAKHQLTIVKNQLVKDTIEVNDWENFKTYSRWVSCPRCNTSGPTIVMRSFNYGNCVCSIWYCGVLWAIFQLFKGKEVKCYDAKHICGKCGELIWDYRSC